MADENTPDPIAAMFEIQDEAERGKPLADAEVNATPPADKAALERDEAGKFKGKDGDKPKAEEKPADAPKADAKAEPKPEDKPKETVPLATFLEKTNKLKEALDAKDITLAQFRKELDELKAKSAPKPEVAPEPDFVEDPKGYVDAKQAAVLKAIAEANEKAAESGKQAKETADQANEQVQLQAFLGDLAKREQVFVAANPHYYEALEHIRGVRAAQLQEFNPDITKEQIVAEIRREELSMAVSLSRQGRDPLQTALNLAKHYGYQPKAAAPPPLAPVAKLPEPSNRLPPDQTLGSGAGGAVDEKEDGAPDPIDNALASLFRKRA